METAYLLFYFMTYSLQTEKFDYYRLDSVILFVIYFILNYKALLLYTPLCKLTFLIYLKSHIVIKSIIKSC